MLSNDPKLINFFQIQETMESLNIIDKLDFENNLKADDNECGYIDTEKYFDQNTNLIFRAKTKSLVQKINKVKNKLLRNAKNHPEEYKKIKELVIKQQKLKEEYPFMFIPGNEDIKKINIFRKTNRNKIKIDCKTSPLKNSKNSNWNRQDNLNKDGFLTNCVDFQTNIITNQTPFQKIQTKNLFKKFLIKEKLTKMNKKFDLNIKSNLIKNLDINDIKKIDNSHFLLKDTEDNFKQYMIQEIKTERVKSGSLNRNFSPQVTQKEYFFSKKKEYNKLTKIRKLDNDIIVIKDLHPNLHKKSKEKFEVKNKIISDLLNKNIEDENKFKNQSTENTEYFFYHKNFNSNGDLKNYFEYKKRPHTNHLQASSNFFSKGRRIISSKIKIDSNKKNIPFHKNFEVENEICHNSQKMKIVYRQHSSIQRKDLSNEIHVVKLDRSLLNKVKSS